MKKEQSQRDVNSTIKLLFREYTESLIVAVLLALILRLFVLAAYKVPTSSMAPSLKAGDFIFAFKIPYGIRPPLTGGKKWGEPQPVRGDVAVFRFPQDPNVNYVKRIIGLPGDRIVIRNRVLFVNGKPASYRGADPHLIDDLPGNEFYSVVTEIQGASVRSVLYKRTMKAETFGPVVVPKQHVFVLGDNRDTSDDSRYWGMVPYQNLEGRVFVIWMSLNWQEKWLQKFPKIRWERVFQRVD